MLADPQSKVFVLLVETLVDFIQVYKDELHDWLLMLVSQLLKLMGTDLRVSLHSKVNNALDLVRESFPCEQQFSILMRFIVDQTQSSSLKMKVAVLCYIEKLSKRMKPNDFANSSEARLAMSRIITWTSEPKSFDVRKAAQAVLISLFDLNTPMYTMLLGALPKTFQDAAESFCTTTCAATAPRQALYSDDFWLTYRLILNVVFVNKNWKGSLAGVGQWEINMTV
uniref:Uncharacterized protein n=1 Tax=Eptatretus burgeri TaxID=7764 RepID=A0A8C4NG50_EPTBU